MSVSGVIQHGLQSTCVRAFFPFSALFRIKVQTNGERFTASRISGSQVSKRTSCPLHSIIGIANSITPQLSQRMGYTNAMYFVRLVPLRLDLHCSSLVG